MNRALENVDFTKEKQPLTILVKGCHFMRGLEGNLIHNVEFAGFTGVLPQFLPQFGRFIASLCEIHSLQLGDCCVFLAVCIQA